ncbi:hypothetical protein RFI_19470 [Reticulomyxa filosa]|uniref:Uncharacterized protein n=1 Tax=Reticulomyxa filosa TaxID=46433 RepID=X6MXP0_RETFI|nr:hypothetical protein RFI_19470 [Reticulomyxa filosa]|eukprot:ETO17840.1 hypothetical protein RFI_19470 [Reticulomyxa filosa]
MKNLYLYICMFVYLFVYPQIKKQKHVQCFIIEKRLLDHQLIKVINMFLYPVQQKNVCIISLVVGKRGKLKNVIIKKNDGIIKKEKKNVIIKKKKRKVIRKKKINEKKIIINESEKKKRKKIIIFKFFSY